MKRDRRLLDAQHEAAHVVVGCALGLRLVRATLQVTAPEDAGEVQFEGSVRNVEAWCLMFAAGVAWERRHGDVAWAHVDVGCLRQWGVKGNARIRTLERAAWALLEGRRRAHTQVTRALLDGGIGPREIAAMVLKENRLRA